MAKVYEEHICSGSTSGHRTYKILNSAANGWIIASRADGYNETVVTGIRYCPFCGEKLPKGGNS